MKKITEVVPNVYCIAFSSKKELGLSFLRFQEYYENPVFRGKYFSMKEYKEWYYSFYKKKYFEYWVDWAGYNISDNVLTPFYEKKFKRISLKEKYILSSFKDKHSPFYIIGCTMGDKTTLKHEIAHAFWKLYPDYKAKMEEYISQIPSKTIEKFKKNLKKIGYNDIVLMDEIHAYLLTDYHTWVHNDFKITIDKTIRNKMKRLYLEAQNKNKLVNHLNEVFKP